VLSTQACVGAKLRKRQQGVPAQITEIAWKAQNRLHKRYLKLIMVGKDHRKIMTAIARELLGFIWAISIKAEQACTPQPAV
jgi:transposase